MRVDGIARWMRGAAALLLAAGAAPVLAQDGGPDGANTAWILTSTALVLFMTLPGLALFYGGLVRSKNVLTVLMQCFSIACLVSVLWYALGYSIAFGTANAWFGGFDRAFLGGVAESSQSGTLPETVFLMFQMTFAIITPALIVGGFAERTRFSAVMIFSALWLLLVYAPVAHWVWGGGWLQQMGLLDFAGGTVVHITAGVAALVAALVIGNRNGFGVTAMPPHNMTMTVTGAGMLWVGWFGFNAGSALAANGIAALAFTTTMLAPAGTLVVWALLDMVRLQKTTAVGAATAIVVGLVAITPAAGNVGVGGALVIGVVAGFACLWGVNGLKHMLGADDSLDVFGVHGVGGIVGALLTGVFNSPALGGPGYVADWVTATAVTAADYSIAAQVWTQAKAVLTTIVWSGVVSFVAYKIVDLTIGLRVSEEDEREGLDITSHGETAYSR